MIDLHIPDETSGLKEVVLGNPYNFGGTPALENTYDPKSREHILSGTFPSQQNIVKEMDYFNDILVNHGVKVHRPQDIPGLNQVFARDIGFVIDRSFIIPRIIEERERELEGISFLLDHIDPAHQITVPEGAKIEGGDVLLADKRIYVGYSGKSDFDKYKVARTNEAGVSFLRESFKHREIIPIALKKSDTIARDNALHLDCCFQPVGRDMAIIHPESFKDTADLNCVLSHFSGENVFTVDREEMYQMNCNIFSLSPDIVVTDRRFTRLNDWLTDKGFRLELLNYYEIAKMEGLLRCSTLPLRRQTT
ncbi:MAG: arginine deiminase-related protein [Cyclobacteriaceae bacterium]